MKKCYWFLKYWRSGLWEDRKQSLWLWGLARRPHQFQLWVKALSNPRAFFCLYVSDHGQISSNKITERTSEDNINSLQISQPMSFWGTCSSWLPVVNWFFLVYYPFVNEGQLFRLGQQRTLQEDERRLQSQSHPLSAFYHNKSIYFCLRSILEWTVRYWIVISHSKGQIQQI